MADAYLTLKLKIASKIKSESHPQIKPEKKSILQEIAPTSNLKLNFFQTFNLKNEFGDKEKIEIKGSTVFKSIQDNFKISIIDNEKEIYSLNISVDEIIPSCKPSKLNFSYSYDKKLKFKGILKIEMYLFPLDTYILDYFYYTTFGPFAMMDTYIEKYDIKIQKNETQNQKDDAQNQKNDIRDREILSLEAFKKIIDSIANEIILYNPNESQRQLDSLTFAASILFLFHECNHISYDLLSLIPTGAYYTFLLENNKNELRNIFLEELRDAKMQLICQKPDLNEEITEEMKNQEIEMEKFFDLKIGIFITKLEKILFQFIAKLSHKLNSNYALKNVSKDKSEQFMTVSNNASVTLYHAKLKLILKESKQLTQEQRHIISENLKPIMQSEKVMGDKQEDKPPINNKFENISLEVDLAPDWILDENDKKDQILVSKKKGTLFFKQHFILFKVEDSDVKIKIPYKIIDSFTRNSPNIIGKNQPVKIPETPKTEPKKKFELKNLCSKSEISEYELDNINPGINKEGDNHHPVEEKVINKMFSVYIYDGSQLYTFKNFDTFGFYNCLELLNRYTHKSESDSFYENLRRSWKKDQLYILQTESFKRLITETGEKIDKFLKNLLNPNTYTLSDIIIMQNSCIQREDVAIDTLDQLKKRWEKSLSKSGEPEKKKQLIKVTQKIFTEKVAVSSKSLFKELMDWVDSLQNSHYIMIEWTDVGRKANKMFQKMKNYSMINVHQVAPVNAGEFFNEQLIKPYLVKYAQMPEE